MNFTSNDIDFMRRCAKRELEKRKQFYPQWVKTGKITQEKADFELDGMKRIAEYFDWLQTHTGPQQQKLF